LPPARLTGKAGKDGKVIAPRWLNVMLFSLTIETSLKLEK